MSRQIGLARRALDGLAPQLVEEIFEVVALTTLNSPRGVVVPSRVTEYAHGAQICRFGYILENGRVVLDGERAHSSENED